MAYNECKQKIRKLLNITISTTAELNKGGFKAVLFICQLSSLSIKNKQNKISGECLIHSSILSKTQPLNSDKNKILSVKPNTAQLWVQRSNNLTNRTFQKKTKQAGLLPFIFMISSIDFYGFDYICRWNLASCAYNLHYQFTQGTEMLFTPSPRYFKTLHLLSQKLS